MIHLVVSARVFHISLRPQKVQLKEKEQTNNMELGLFQAQEREFVWRFYAALRAFCWLSWACILRETSTTTRNANSFLTAFPHCLLLLTVRPLDSVVDCSLWVPLSNGPCLLSDLPFLLHFRSRERSRVQALCWGFTPKQTKRSSAWRITHIVSQTCWILTS